MSKPEAHVLNLRDMKLLLDGWAYRLKTLHGALFERLAEIYTVDSNGRHISDGKAYVEIQALLPRLQGLQKHFLATMQGIDCLGDLVQQAEALLGKGVVADASNRSAD